jgi:hypothetical protein
MKARNVATMLLALTLCASAQAGELRYEAQTTVYFDRSFESTKTVIDRIQVPSFPASAGTLKKVELRLSIDLTNRYGVENFGCCGVTTTSDLWESFSIYTANDTHLASLVHLNTGRRFDLSAYDGNDDYAGSSGDSTSFQLSEEKTVHLNPTPAWTSAAGPEVQLGLKGTVELGFSNNNQITRLDSVISGKAVIRVQVIYTY